LIEWTINYIKNKDLIRKDLEKIEKSKQGFDLIVKFKDKEQFFIIKPQIEKIEEIINKLNEKDAFGLVMLNTTKNFEILVENWNKLTNFTSLTLYFVNTFSKLDKKWVTNPHVHHKVCDENSLKTGLKSMFDMVTPLTEQDIESKFK